MGESAVGPPGDFEQQDDLVFCVLTGRRCGGTAVMVDGHAELLAYLPERLVVLGVVQGWQPDPGGAPGSSTPPLRPADFAHRISSTLASMSCNMIWQMPARRPGVSAQNSAIQRLCACRPAHRASQVTGVLGGWLLCEGGLREEGRDRVRER